MNVIRRKLAVVTGACTGMGLELARLCARQGFELIMVADDTRVHDLAQELGRDGTSCLPVQCDLATSGGIASLMAVIASRERPVDFLFADAVRVIQTNIDATVRLVFAVAGGMRSRGRGRILISGSTARRMPAAYQAVYDVSKTFLDAFALALSHELKDTDVTVASLIPGAREIDSSPERAALIARIGFDALMEGNPAMVANVASALPAASSQLRAHP